MTPIDFAIQELGKQEVPKGSNWGPDVQKYLKSVGINFPASWCMAFVYWCFDEWAHITNHANPLERTGGVLAQWSQIKAENKFTISKFREYPNVYKPKPNDIAIFNHGKGFGHTGIVEYAFEDGTKFQTIEGNTNDTGSREGFEVERKIHDINESQLIGFIRVPVETIRQNQV